MCAALHASTPWWDERSVPRDTARLSQPTPLARSPAPAVTAPPHGLRVLCLHGYVQSGAIFRERTGSLRKALKGLDFFFVDAPHSAAGAFQDPAHPPTDPPVVDARGWWHAGENATQSGWTRPSVSLCATGADHSLAFLRETLAREGPFDGLLGFSQGAAMAAQLLAAEPSCARFAILVAGFVPYDPLMASRVLDAAPLPHAVLSVCGETDALVPQERVRQLAACFEGKGSAIYVHPGGHGVPSNAAFRTAVKAFLANV